MGLTSWLVRILSIKSRSKRATNTNINISSTHPSWKSLIKFTPPELVQGDVCPDLWVTESTQNKIVSGPLDYILSTPGKNTRNLLIDAFNAWLEVPEPLLEVIKNVITILHTASLLVDDIEDNSILRRGRPAAHIIFGTPQTINSANYAFFVAFKELQNLNHRLASEVFMEELINLHLGQGMDLYWRDSSICPSEEEYLGMVNNKTAGLFRLAIRLMQLESPCSNLEEIAITISRNYVPMAEIIGKIFQIRDDYKNLQSDEYTKQKGACEDITEGKFSFPIIHSIHANPENKTLRSILTQKTNNILVKDIALSCLDSTGSFEYTRRAIEELVQQAEILMNDLDDGKGKYHGVYEILKLLQC